MKKKSNKNKKNKTPMSVFLYYSLIIILTVAAYALIITVLSIEEIPELIEMGDVSVKNFKLVLVIMVITTYLASITIPIRKILNSSLENRIGPTGDKGTRGLRGNPGGDAICNSCSDDLCYRKIMFHITRVYNFWRKIHNLPRYSEDYLIPNAYLQNKIRRHCKSKEFNKILKK